MMKIIVIFCLLYIHSFALDNLYFFPKDSKNFQKDFEFQIKNAKESIEIAIYNHSYQKFTTLFNEAAKRGVKIKFFYYKKKADLSNGGIEVIKIKDKLHTKLAIIDRKVVVFGSTNWTDESFKENIEVVYMSDRLELVEQFVDFYQSLEKNKRNLVKESK